MSAQERWHPNSDNNLGCGRQPSVPSGGVYKGWLSRVLSSRLPCLAPRVGWHHEQHPVTLARAQVAGQDRCEGRLPAGTTGRADKWAPNLIVSRVSSVIILASLVDPTKPENGISVDSQGTPQANSPHFTQLLCICQTGMRLLVTNLYAPSPTQSSGIVSEITGQCDTWDQVEYYSIKTSTIHLPSVY